MTQANAKAAPKFTKDKDVLAKTIIQIKASGTKLDNLIQFAALSALHHVIDNGDVGFINRLYLSMPKGARKAALSSWFLSYGPLVANTAENKADMPFKYTKDKVGKFEQALNDPWFNHKPDQKPDEVFDLQKAIESIIKRAQGKELVHAGLLEKLQELVTAPEGDSTDDGDESK